jgi:hypothetical protein
MWICKLRLRATAAFANDKVVSKETRKGSADVQKTVRMHVEACYVQALV